MPPAPQRLSPRAPVMPIALSLALASCAPPAQPPPSPPLDALLSFADAPSCTPAAPFQALLDSLFQPVDEGARFVPGRPAVPPALRSAIGKLTMSEPERGGIGAYEASLTIRGTWRGLPVTAISSHRVPEGDAEGFAVAIASKPARVRAAVNALGFAVPPQGERTTGDGLTTWIGVDAAPGGAVFYCSTG